MLGDWGLTAFCWAVLTVVEEIKAPVDPDATLFNSLGLFVHGEWIRWSSLCSVVNARASCEPRVNGCDKVGSGEGTSLGAGGEMHKLCLV